MLRTISSFSVTSQALPCSLHQFMSNMFHEVLTFLPTETLQKKLNCGSKKIVFTPKKENLLSTIFSRLSPCFFHLNPMAAMAFGAAKLFHTGFRLNDLRSATGSAYSVALAQLRSSSSHQRNGRRGGTTTRFSWASLGEFRPCKNPVKPKRNGDLMGDLMGFNGMCTKNIAVSGSCGKMKTFLAGNGENKVIQ